MSRRVENSLSYGHPHLYSKSGPGTILQDVTMASMSGTLAQLGLVSHYAAELFEDLFSLSKDLYERVDRVQNRTGKLVDQLSEVSKKMDSLDGTVSSVQVPHETEAPDRIAFDEASMPRSMRERYQDVTPVPDFSGIDKLLPEKSGPCSQKYSYPGLFLDQWAAEEMKRISALKAQRAEKRAGRKEKKKRPSSIKGPSKWKDRYNVEGEEHSSKKQSPRPSSTSLSSSPGAPTSKDHKTPPPPPSKEATPSQIKMQRPSLIPAPPTLKKSKTPSPPSFKRPPPPPLPPTIVGSADIPEEEEEESTTVKEEVAEEAAPTQREEEEDEFVGASSASKENQELAKFFKMLQLHIPKEAVAQKMRNEGFDPSVLDDDSDDEEDDASVSASAAATAASSIPPPPPPSSKMDDDESTNDSSSPRQSVAADSPRQSPAKIPTPVATRPTSSAPSGLLGAIQQGKTLKKVEVNKPKTEEPKNDLLAAIKAGATLRKRDPAADDAEKKKPQAAANAGGLFGAVDKILSLRDKMEIDSDSEDDSDWDDDDDSDF